jgi:hypothetical protein
MSHIKTNIIVDVADLIDHSVRICGIPSPNITPEIVKYSKENLLHVLMKLNNRGVTLYSIIDAFQGFTPAQYKYTLNDNVIDIFNLNWRTMSHLYATPTGGVDPQYLNDYLWDTYAVTSNYFILQYGQNYYTSYYGLCFYGTQTNTITISASTDGVNYTIINSYATTTYQDGTWLWSDIQVPPFGTFIKVSIEGGEELSLRGLFSGSPNSISEIPCAKLNADDYFAYTNKGVINGTPLNYYFYKSIHPEIWLWQAVVGTSVFNWNIHYRSYNTVDEFINLPNALSIPVWAQNAIKWGLAAENCFQLAGVPPDRINMIQERAQNEMSEAEAANTDTAPINLIGAIIQPYTRL